MSGNFKIYKLPCLITQRQKCIFFFLLRFLTDEIYSTFSGIDVFIPRTIEMIHCIRVIEPVMRKCVSWQLRNAADKRSDQLAHSSSLNRVYGVCIRHLWILWYLKGQRAVVIVTLRKCTGWLFFNECSCPKINFLILLFLFMSNIHFIRNPNFNVDKFYNFKLFTMWSVPSSVLAPPSQRLRWSLKDGQATASASALALSSFSNDISPETIGLMKTKLHMKPLWDGEYYSVREVWVT